MSQAYVHLWFVTYVLWINGAVLSEKCSKQLNRVAWRLPCGTKSDSLQFPYFLLTGVLTAP